MVRTQRAVPHDTEARQAMALLQGEAAEELRVVDDQQEVAAGASRSLPATMNARRVTEWARHPPTGPTATPTR